jgi:hypothetical protein
VTPEERPALLRTRIEMRTLLASIDEQLRPIGRAPAPEIGTRRADLDEEAQRPREIDELEAI